MSLKPFMNTFFFFIVMNVFFKLFIWPKIRQQWPVDELLLLQIVFLSHVLKYGSPFGLRPCETEGFFQWNVTT